MSALQTTKYLVTSSNNSPAAGSDVTITAQLADPNDNPIAIAGLTVTWSKSNGNGSFATATSQTDASGIATIVFTTHTVAGTATTVTATDNNGLTGTSSTISTKSGAASKYLVTSSNNNPGAGNQVTITAQLADANNNRVATSGLTVTWEQTDVNGTFSSLSSQTDASGIASIVFTTHTAAGTSTTITASDERGLTGTSATVVTGSGTPTKYLVSTSNDSPEAGSNVVITAQLVDSNNNPVTIPGLTVTWAKSNANGTFASSTSQTNVNGLATIVFTTHTVSGTTCTITATDNNGLSGTSNTVTTGSGTPIKYIVTASNNRPAAGSAVTVTAQLVDAYNNPVANPGLTVYWSKPNGVFSELTSHTNDRGIATVQFTTHTVAGTVSAVTATDENTLTGTTTPIITGSGQATKYLVTSSNNSPAAGSNVIITAQLADAHNNPVATPGLTVTWVMSNGSFAAATSQTNASGIATIVFTTHTVAGTATTITATDNSGFTGTSATIVTGSGTATKYLVTSSNNNPSAGTDVTITAQLADAYNNPVPTEGITVTWAKSNANGTFESATSQTNSCGIATIVFTPHTVAGTKSTVTATDNNALTGTSNTITTLCGAANKYHVTPSNKNPEAGSQITISAQLVDINSNPVGSAGLIVTWAKSNPNGTFAAATSQTNEAGLANVVFATHTVAGTATTITATDNNALTGNSPVIITDNGPSPVVPTDPSVIQGNDQSSTESLSEVPPAIPDMGTSHYSVETESVYEVPTDSNETSINNLVETVDVYEVPVETSDIETSSDPVEGESTSEDSVETSDIETSNDPEEGESDYQAQLDNPSDPTTEPVLEDASNNERVGTISDRIRMFTPVSSGPKPTTEENNSDAVISNEYGQDNGTDEHQTVNYLYDSENLQDISISGSPQNFNFDPQTYSYSQIIVENSVDAITVTPTGAGNLYVEGEQVISGSPSSEIQLKEGEQRTFTVIATEPGKSPKAYKFEVTRSQAEEISYFINPEGTQSLSTSGENMLVDTDDELSNSFLSPKENGTNAIEDDEMVYGESQNGSDTENNDHQEGSDVQGIAQESGNDNQAEMLSDETEAITKSEDEENFNLQDENNSTIALTDDESEVAETDLKQNQDIHSESAGAGDDVDSQLESSYTEDGVSENGDTDSGSEPLAYENEGVEDGAENEDNTLLSQNDESEVGSLGHENADLESVSIHNEGGSSEIEENEYQSELIGEDEAENNSEGEAFETEDNESQLDAEEDGVQEEELEESDATESDPEPLTYESTEENNEYQGIISDTETQEPELEPITFEGEDPGNSEDHDSLIEREESNSDEYPLANEEDSENENEVDNDNREAEEVEPAAEPLTFENHETEIDKTQDDLITAQSDDGQAEGEPEPVIAEYVANENQNKAFDTESDGNQVQEPVSAGILETTVAEQEDSRTFNSRSQESPVLAQTRSVNNPAPAEPVMPVASNGGGAHFPPFSGGSTSQPWGSAPRSGGQKSKNKQFTDLGAILKRYLYHWPLFLLGLIITISLAITYLKITPPVYEVSATILVKDAKKTSEDKSALQELDESRAPKSAETEIQILRSKKLINKVINDLQLWTTYTTKDGLTKEDLYETPPFKFVAADKSNILKQQSFDIVIKSKNNFEIKNLPGGLKSGSFNKVLKSGFGRWVLKPTEFLDQYIGSTITVTINGPEKVSNAYLKGLDTHLLDKAAPTIGLFVTDRIPKRGKDFLNYLIKTYNEASVDEEKRTTKSTIEFIDKRLASLTGELNSAERQVEGYRSSQGLTDINSQSQVYLENVQTNDNKLNEVNVQLNVIEGIERYVNSNAAGQSPPATIGITDPTLNNLIEKLSDLQLQRTALLATTPEENPAFEPINNQIASTKSAIQQTVRGIKSSLVNSKRQLNAFNNKFESSIKDIPVQERQYIGMKRQESIKENLYVYLLQKREELALSYASTFVDARIVDKANVGEIKWPRSSVVLAIALILGLGFPFIIVFFRQSFNNTITERRDIENAIEVPILGELSYEDLGKNIIVLDNSRHIISEQFRSLRTNLHYLHENRKNIGRVTLFTSSTAGEGKSFVSSNLATSLAATGRRTVILEMDLRRPKILSIFNFPQEHLGISDFLSSDISVDHIIQPSGIVPTLDIIGSGYIPPNPSELLERNRLYELITELKQRYDDVVIDSPPLHLVTDAMIIARMADVSLYIIRQGHSQKAELDFIEKVYDDNRLPKMNLIFNGIKKGKYGYGYTYDNSYYAEASKPTFKTSFKLFLSRF